MNAIDHILPGGDTVTRLGWVLVHFLWQGAVIAAVLALALMLLRNRSAQARYAAAYAALLVAATMPLATWMWLAPRQAQRFDAAPVPIGVTTNPPAEPAAFGSPLEAMRLEQHTAARAPTGSLASDILPPLVGVWFAGVVALSIYRAGGWIYVQFLRRLGTVERDSHLTARLDRLRDALRVRRHVRILHCPRIDSPAVVGVIKPMILLPLACVLSVSPQQLEAILAHELAHIRRHDYLLNLIQTAVETLLFFHPGIWWISRRIRIEREYAADDLALRALPDRVAYADALASQEELRIAPAPALAARGGTLLARVQRVLGRGNNASDRATWWPAAGLAVLALGVVVGMNGGFVSAMDESVQPATSPASKVVSLTCVDTSGKPVAGAEVFLIGSFREGDSVRWIAPAPLRTDADGVARFEGLPDVPPDRASVQVYARLSAKLAGLRYQTATVVDGRPWDERFQVIMHPSRTLHVRLKDVPNGVKFDPLRAELWLMDNLLAAGPGTGGQFTRIIPYGKQEFWPELFAYAIADDGTFTVPDVPANAIVSVLVSGPGIATEVISHHFNRPDAGNEATVKLAAEAIIEGSLVYHTFPRRAAAGVEIRCQYQPHSVAQGGRVMSLFTEAGEDGRFQFRGLRQGIYSLKVIDVPDGFAALPAAVRVEHGQRIDDLKIALQPGKVLNGTVVTAADGKPVPGAVVYSRVSGMLGIESSVSRSEPTGADGRFAIRLPEGTLDLAVTPPKGLGRGQNVTLAIRSGADELPEIMFKLAPWEPGPDDARLARLRAPRGTLRGRVVDPQGRPVAHLQVRVNQIEAGRMRMGMGTGTKEDGTYELANLESGVEYQVFIPDWSTTAAELDRVKLEPNQTIELDDLRVTPRAMASQVAGMVVDQQGRPISDAWVSVGQYFGVRTGDDGAFRFDLYDADKPVDIEVSAESYQRKVHRGIAPGTGDLKLVMQPKVPGSSEY